MDLKCQQLGFNVSDIKASREFYADKLGLEVIDEKGGNFFAVRAGNVRFSFFGVRKSSNTPTGT